MRSNFDMNKGPINVEWCIGAETNVAYNCLDRHVKAGKASIVWLSKLSIPYNESYLLLLTRRLVFHIIYSVCVMCDKSL